MRKIDFQEDFHLELKKKIFFFSTSVSTGREGFKGREQSGTQKWFFSPEKKTNDGP